MRLYTLSALSLSHCLFRSLVKLLVSFVETLTCTDLTNVKRGQRRENGAIKTNREEKLAFVQKCIKNLFKKESKKKSK